MSRAYRIQVRESLRRVIRARDKISTQLELLEILPAEVMAELLGEELAGRGFRRKGNQAVRTKDGATVTVELDTGTLTVETEATKEVKVTTERETWSYEEMGRSNKQMREALRAQAKKELEQKVEGAAADLQTAATDRLEAQLGDLKKEIDQAVNRVTAEALKRKAASLGQIKEMTEDPQTGSLTITIEV